jgi:hypothetical protein
MENKSYLETLENGVTISALQTTPNSTWVYLKYGKWETSAAIFPGVLSDAVKSLKNRADKFLASVTAQSLTQGAK